MRPCRVRRRGRYHLAWHGSQTCLRLSRTGKRTRGCCRWCSTGCRPSTRTRCSCTSGPVWATPTITCTTSPARRANCIAAATISTAGCSTTCRSYPGRCTWRTAFSRCAVTTACCRRTSLLSSWFILPTIRSSSTVKDRGFYANGSCGVMLKITTPRWVLERRPSFVRLARM